MIGLSKRFVTCGVLAACIFLGGSVQAQDVEEVIARHVEAKGGASAWEAVTSMRITGSYTAFSIPKPFTLIRKRPCAYYFDHYQGEKRVVVHFDGKTAHWLNPWQGFDWPVKPPREELAVLIQDGSLGTPFLDYPGNGARVEFLGQTDLDGEDALQLRLTRKEGIVEMWYLDANTSLEIARFSKGADFGREVEMTTFFSDFRKVEGLMIPHLVESEFHTRDRMMRVDKVEINVPVEEEIFQRPPVVGMTAIGFMRGHWDVAVEERSSPREEWKESKAAAVIESLVGGALLIERLKTQSGDEVVRSWSYDRFKKNYRVTQLDDVTTHLNVLEGKIEDSALIVSTQKTGTAARLFGQTVQERITMTRVDAKGFGLVRERSFDDGASWFPDLHLDYVKRK